MTIVDVSTQLLPLAFVTVIRSEPSHGYGVRNLLKEKGFGDFKGATIYPLLKRLEKEGAISSEWVLPDSGSAKKVYSISKEGEHILKDGLVQLHNVISIMKEG